MQFNDRRGVPIERAAIAALRSRAEYALSIVLPALERAGVRALLVKGILTGRWLFADPFERPLTDIDVRVCARDLDAIAALCAAQGWKITERSSLYRNITFVVEDTPFDVETTVGARAMSALSVEAMLARAVRSNRDLPIEHWRIDVYDHGMLLAMNVLKDQLGRSFRWSIEDLIRVADRPEFVPSRMAERAWSAANASALAGIARWLERTERSAAWGEVRAAIGRPPRPRYAALVARALCEPDALQSNTLRTLVARSASDRVEQRVEAIAVAAAWGPPRLAFSSARAKLRQFERWRASLQQTPETPKES